MVKPRYISVRSALVVAVSALLGSNLSAQTVLFSDDFDSDTSGSWALFEGSGNTTPDFMARFAFDYSTNKFVRNGVTNFIPSAPNSMGGSTKGLKITVNKNDDVAATAAVSAYPMGQSFSNNYALKFDMWINYTGSGFGTGTGGTEYSTFGINHPADKVNWQLGTVSDGAWFAVNGDADSATFDYQSWVGDNAGTPLLADGFLDRDGVDGPETAVDGGQPPSFPLKLLFPSPQFETTGMPSKQWVQVEVRQRTNDLGAHIVTWLINGYVIAEHSNGDTVGQIAGNVMLGHSDTFSGIASPREDGFVIFDNVRVVELTNTPVVLSVTAADPDAAEAGTDLGTFTISRTGDTSAPLTVNYRLSGTASNGTDYTTVPTSVTIAGGQTSTNITITPVNDPIGEGTETAILTLTGSADFDVREQASATVNIVSDDIPTASIVTIRPVAYELIPGRAGKLAVSLSNPNALDTTINYSISGTAANGTDYATIPASVTIAAGETSTNITITSINNSNLNDGTRVVTLTLTAGAGYTLGPNNNASVSIRNDDIPAGTLAFSDNFDTDTTGSWNVNVGPEDNAATFFYDYSADGIPPAPNSTGGSTRGVKLVSNQTAALFTGLSVSPIDQGFQGDHRLRFDMWINYNGPLAAGGAGSTQMGTAGVGTDGVTPKWPGGPAGPSAYFAVTGDGGSTIDYRAYTNAGAPLAATSGAYAAGTGTAPDSRQANHPYYEEFGGVSAPQDQINIQPDQTGTSSVGSMGMVWHDVVISKEGSNVTWFIDGLKIATIDITGLALSTNIFVGNSDINAGVTGNPAMSFTLVDNVRVETIQAPLITSIQIVGGNVQIDFTGVASDTEGDFTLQSAGVVTGPYVDVPSVRSQLSPGMFRAVRPLSGSMQFYRIRR